jgi:hypothetical protein
LGFPAGTGADGAGVNGVAEGSDVSEPMGLPQLVQNVPVTEAPQLEQKGIANPPLNYRTGRVGL